MALVDPERPEDQMALLDEASIYFLRAIKQHYTRDTSLDVMEALTPILGKDWKGRIIFGLMANKHQAIRAISINRMTAPALVNKIKAIKEVRAISRLGLVEAKTLVEAAYERSQVVKVAEQPETMSQDSWNLILSNSINAIKDAGFRVEIS